MPTSGTFFIEISGVFWQGKVLGIMNAMTKFNIGIYIFYFLTMENGLSANG